jgi:tetratricopeptide (TPR) repeat protein
MQMMTERIIRKTEGRAERLSHCNNRFLRHFIVIVNTMNQKMFYSLLMLIASNVAIAALLFCNPIPVIAEETARIEALLELDPLDWSSIDAAKIIDECTLALANKQKLNKYQINQCYLLRGIALCQERKIDDAVRDLTEVLTLQPNDCRALRFRGIAYAGNKQYDMAHKDFEALVKLNPKSAFGYASLALCSYEAGDLVSSKEFAKKAIELDPDEPGASLARSLAHMKENNIKESLKCINRCITLNYGRGTVASAEPYYVRAALHLFLDNPKKALPDLLMARRLNPNDITLKRGFCEYYFKTGKYNLALHISKELAEEKNMRPLLYAKKVDCLIARNRQEEALHLAESFIRHAPERGWGFFYRGKVLFSFNKYKEALQDFNKSLAVSPDTCGTMAAKAYLLAACPVAQLRDGLTARKLAKRCCEITDYQAPRYLMLLAMASAECGEYNESVRLAKESIKKMYPDFPFSTDYKRRLTLFEKGKPYRCNPDSSVIDYLFP